MLKRRLPCATEVIDLFSLPGGVGVLGKLSMTLKNPFVRYTGLGRPEKGGLVYSKQGDRGYQGSPVVPELWMIMHGLFCKS